MKPAKQDYGFLIFCGVIAAFAGGILGRVVRYVGEESGAYDGRWGGVVGVFVAMVLLIWLDSDG